MSDPENGTPPWWANGVFGLGTWEELQRRGDAPAPGDPLWRFENVGEGAVVLGVAGHEPTALAPGEAVEFLAREGFVLAVADPERPGVVFAFGPVERLAAPYPSSRPPR